MDFSPRCQASCVAVTTAISLMLSRDSRCLKKDGTYKTEDITTLSYEEARKLVPPEQVSTCNVLDISFAGFDYIQTHESIYEITYSNSSWRKLSFKYFKVCGCSEKTDPGPWCAWSALCLKGTLRKALFMESYTQKYILLMLIVINLVSGWFTWKQLSGALM